MSVYVAASRSGSVYSSGCHKTLKRSCPFIQTLTCRTSRTTDPVMSNEAPKTVKLTPLKLLQRVSPLPASENPLVSVVSSCLCVSLSARRVSLAEDVPAQTRSGQCGVAAAGRWTGLSCPESWMLLLPNNNPAAMARLVPLLFVQKCHGRAETNHVTAKRGGRKQHKYEQR